VERWDPFLQACVPNLGPPPPNNRLTNDAARSYAQAFDDLVGAPAADAGGILTTEIAIPYPGIGGVPRVGLPRIGLTPAQRRAALLAALVALGCTTLTSDQADVRTQPRDDEQAPRYLYHYTRFEFIPLIIATGLRPSIRIAGDPKSDAQWGDGQYLTDLTPEESGTVTRSQHSYALFKIPWKWGGSGNMTVGWIQIAVQGLPVDRVAPLFGRRFPHRSIYLNESILSLSLANRVTNIGSVLFQPSPSGYR
jgi:hypothetical protein